MNLTALLAFESLVYPGLQNDTIRNLVADSLRAVLQQAYIEVATMLMVMTSCRYEGVLEFMGSVMQRLRDVQVNGTLQLIQQNHRRPLRFNGRFLFNLVLVDSLEGFNDLQLAAYVHGYDMNEYTYVFLQQRDHLVDGDMQAVFEYCWRHHMINCNVQTQSASGEIRMYTYYPYTRRHCGRVVPQLINTFEAVGGWRQRDALFPHKLTNFYGCPLVVAVRVLPPFLKLYNATDKLGALGLTCNHKVAATTGAQRLGGFEGCLLVELAKYMNFSIVIKPLEVDDRTGEYCCGIMAWLRSRTIDLGVGYFRKRTFMAPISTDVFPHYQNEMVSAVNVNAHNLTAYEVLLYPFDGYTWLSVAGALLFVYACTELIYRCERHRHRTTHRRCFTFTALVSATLGVAVTREPRTLHNRLVFSVTMWTTLLLRGIYTGILYSVFRDSIHRPLPIDGQQLIERDYVAVMNGYALKDIAELPDLSKYRNIRSIILRVPDEFAAFPLVQAQEHDRYFVVSAREYLVYYATKHQQPGKFHTLPGNVMTQQLCIYLVKHSFLVNQMDMTIMRFHAAGVMQFLQQRTLSDAYFKSQHLYGPKFINQRDLMAIYALVGVLQLVALVVFLLELAARRRCTRLRVLFGDAVWQE